MQATWQRMIGGRIIKIFKVVFRKWKGVSVKRLSFLSVTVSTETKSRQALSDFLALTFDLCCAVTYVYMCYSLYSLYAGSFGVFFFQQRKDLGRKGSVIQYKIQQK